PGGATEPVLPDVAEAACQIQDQEAVVFHLEVPGLAEPRAISVVPELDLYPEPSALGGVGQHSRRLRCIDPPVLADRAAHTPGPDAATASHGSPRRCRANGRITFRPDGNSYRRLTSRYRPAPQTASRQASDCDTTASASDRISDSHTARGAGLVTAGWPLRN